MEFKLKPNDIKFLVLIAEHSVLTTSQIAASTQKSRQAVRKRVRQLVKHGFIALRPLGFGRGQGRPEGVIALTDIGFQTMQENGLLSENYSFSCQGSNDALCVEHDLLVNWFWIHLLRVGDIADGIAVQFLSSTSASKFSPQGEGPLALCVPLGNGLKKTIEFFPDGVFSITNLKVNPVKSLLFFLEVDMGTETVVSGKRGHKDIRQKIINYQALFRSGHYKRFEDVFNARINGFRLLFLANSSARLNLLCRFVRQMPPSDFIWLTDSEQMFSHGLSDKTWARGGNLDTDLQSILGPRLCCQAPVLENLR